MARIVLGLGASHTPLLTLTSEQWSHRAAVDYANPRLNLSDGRWLSYEALLAEVGPRHEAVVTPEVLDEKARLCEAALQRLGDELQAAQPDVVVIVGDDQSELFGPANQPVIAVYHGAEIVTHDKFGRESTPQWMRDMGRGYLMDHVHRVPGCPEFALDVIGSLVEQNIDVATVASVDDPQKAGFGHAYGFIIKRVMRERPIPVLPIMLNTYYPPNVPTAARVVQMGRALAKAIADSPRELRVAVVASGGLSHFVVDEQLDRGLIKAFVERDLDALARLPRGALNSGSSEILNWVMTAGAVSELPVRWHEYYPLYRTPAGTGVGAAFVAWRDGA